MTPVQSSNIKALAHDASTGKLRVQFHSGATWEYDDVDPKHHDAMTAPGASVGGYFHKHIRNAHKGQAVDDAG